MSAPVSPPAVPALATDSIISRFNIDSLRFPLLISVPHAGRVYSKEIYQNLRVPAANLMRLEDRYSDRLATDAIAAGLPTIIARQPRAWIDLNRHPSELDPDMITGARPSQFRAPSRKVRGGLGVIPSRLSGVGNLWQRKWSIDAIQNRLQTYHEPYHANIAQVLERMRMKFGCALLLDVHSMPPLEPSQEAATIIIGDRFGRSAGSRYSAFASGYFEQADVAVRLNHPYAGGYILERHSDVEREVHAIQLEIDRGCYLDSDLNEPGPGLPEMAGHVATLALRLADKLNGQFQLAAAE